MPRLVNLVHRADCAWMCRAANSLLGDLDFRQIWCYPEFVTFFSEHNRNISALQHLKSKSIKKKVKIIHNPTSQSWIFKSLMYFLSFRDLFFFFLNIVKLILGKQFNVLSIFPTHCHACWTGWVKNPGTCPSASQGATLWSVALRTAEAWWCLDPGQGAERRPGCAVVRDSGILLGRTGFWLLLVAIGFLLRWIPLSDGWKE